MGLLEPCPFLGVHVFRKFTEYYSDFLSQVVSDALLYRCISTTCSPISYAEIAGARPNMNIKVAAYVMTYLHYNSLMGQI